MLIARGFAGPTVAVGDVKVAIVLVSRLRQRIENQITHRVNDGVESDPQQFASGALECRVVNVRVRPFD